MKKLKIRADVPKEPALVIENQLLLAPGVWNGVPLSDTEIKKGLTITDWNDKRNHAIYFGHDPKKTENWIGNYENRRYLTLSDGVETEGIYADLHIYDINAATKLAYGGARWAASMGMDYAWGRTGPYDIKYNHLGIVYDPGCKNERVFLNLENTEMKEGERYDTEIRYDLNLEVQEEKPIYTSEKEETKMTEQTEVTKSAELDVDKIKEVVLNVLQSQKEVETEKLKQRAEDEIKIKEDANKIASERVEMEKAKLEKTYKEEVEQKDSKIVELTKKLEETNKASIPQTVAKPNGDSSPFASQAEIAHKLVENLNRK
jgi:hypothetical protein